MKTIVRFAALAVLVTGAYVSNTHAVTTKIAMKSAAPVPVCAPSDPNGCGIGAW